MSKFTPERALPLSAKKPNADFNWPPTEEELARHSAETVQRLNRYLDHPTDLEPPQTNIETWESQALKPRADFNWPPAEDQLAAGGSAGRNNVAASEGTAGASDGSAVSTPAASNAASLSSVSMPSKRPTAVISHDASRIPADAGQAIARDDEAVMGAVPTPSEADEPEYVGDSLSVIAVAQSEAAFDGTGTGDWAADFARLQAVIERVTEKVEWRITSVTGH